MATQVLFQMPNSPEEFGVALAPAELRRLDFSALDFTALSQAGIEYIRTYFPTQFNDFATSNGVIMMLELVSYIGGVLTERADVLIDEAFLSTAQTEDAVIQHLALIGQQMERATPAVVDVEISITNAAPTEIKIQAGTRVTVTGVDQSSAVNYELFRSPGDFSSPISIPPGKRGVIAYGIEGVTDQMRVAAIGGAKQFVDIPVSNVLDEPIFVQVISGSVSRLWQRVDIIEKSGSNDEVYEVRHYADKTRVQFGDDVNGKSPLAGQIILVTYRAGGGVRGRIAASQINESRAVTPSAPASAAVEALFRNPLPSSGGTDDESITQAKRRAPRLFATHDNAVSGEDYGLLASLYSHPVYGAVAKAVGIVRTGVDLPSSGSGGSYDGSASSNGASSLSVLAAQVRAAPTLEQATLVLDNHFVNRNIVELYVLSAGPGNTLSQPSTGLKEGLVTYFADKSVLTDEVRVFDGAIKPVNIEATIVISKNADPGTVKAAVQSVIDDFFDLRNFDMGTGLYLSSLYNNMQSVPGVKFVDIFNPADDILATNKVGDPTSKGVGFNEVIVLGQVNLKFFFEAGSYRIPPLGKV
jgi:uncharacterized phage protein gp47/JayE